MAENEMRMKIEDDGTVTIDSQSFESGAMHLQAEELVNTTFEELGGERKVLRRKPHTHAHASVASQQKQKAG